MWYIVQCIDAELLMQYVTVLITFTTRCGHFYSESVIACSQENNRLVDTRSLQYRWDLWIHITNLSKNSFVNRNDVELTDKVGNTLHNPWVLIYFTNGTMRKQICSQLNCRAIGEWLLYIHMKKKKKTEKLPHFSLFILPTVCTWEGQRKPGDSNNLTLAFVLNQTYSIANNAMIMMRSSVPQNAKKEMASTAWHFDKWF